MCQPVPQFKEKEAGADDGYDNSELYHNTSFQRCHRAKHTKHPLNLNASVWPPQPPRPPSISILPVSHRSEAPCHIQQQASAQSLIIVFELYAFRLHPKQTLQIYR